MAKCDDYPTGIRALRAYIHDVDGPRRLSRDAIQRALNEHGAVVSALRRVASLNENAGEIGEGMLRMIVTEARAALAEVDGR